MPAWIHDRAKHIQAENPGMPESESWAIATQQSHATGHTPKSYGTPQGKHEAKKKYDEPKSHYELKADPDKTKTAMLAGFVDELEKIANLAATGTQMNKATNSLSKLPGPVGGMRPPALKTNSSITPSPAPAMPAQNPTVGAKATAPI